VTLGGTEEDKISLDPLLDSQSTLLQQPALVLHDRVPMVANFGFRRELDLVVRE
jgi:hypothetical protein